VIRRAEYVVTGAESVVGVMLVGAGQQSARRAATQ
jgi:hypothetical protein